MPDEQLRLINPTSLCADCGRSLDLATINSNQVNTSGNTICNECAEDYVPCIDCHNIILQESAYHREVDDDNYCVDCYNLHRNRCQCCGNIYDAEAAEAWGNMCPSCANDHFVCDSCGGTFHVDDYGDDGCCSTCSAQTSYIKEYHSGATGGIQFLPSGTFESVGQKLHFGVELETDDFHSSRERNCAGTKLEDISQDESLFWMENDGSLDDGIEIITQPATLKYHQLEFPWKKITDIIEDCGGKSHDTHTCGLHIHFSRAFFYQTNYLYKNPTGDLRTIRLLYLFEKFWEQLVVFSRRNPKALAQNAEKYGCPLLDKRATDKISDIHHEYSRYYAVNLHPRETIEIRLFRGTLNPDTIIGSIELVDLLVRMAKKMSTKKLQGLTWTDLVERTRKSTKYIHLFDTLKRCKLVEGEENVPNSNQTKG